MWGSAYLSFQKWIRSCVWEVETSENPLFCKMEGNLKFLRVKPRSEGVRKKDEKRKTEGGKKSQRSVSACGSMWSKMTQEEFLLMERQGNLEHKISNIQC